MRAERWARIKAAFQTAAELGPGYRTAFLDQACADEPDLRQEVEALLFASDSAGDFIEVPALEPFAGRRVGPYRLMRELGHGGMGTVYLAARADHHFEQQVAVKIVKRGMDTEFILRRFRNERQILAGFDHPNIGRLFDGGATEDGLPYFVMELIEGGKSIDEYCDAHQLSTIERLKLFRIVCGAVHYAHSKMVVHRDIKPGNILISPEGAPKLLDFGIAKILGPDQSGTSTDPTATSLRIMTPAYASPEQVRGETITPASDIYSLGVLLYELLTGHRPYRLKGRAPHEVAQVICEERPSRPSMAVSRTEEIETGDGATLNITPETVSRTRDGEPRKLRRILGRSGQHRAPGATQGDGEALRLGRSLLGRYRAISGRAAGTRAERLGRLSRGQIPAPPCKRGGGGGGHGVAGGGRLYLARATEHRSHRRQGGGSQPAFRGRAGLSQSLGPSGISVAWNGAQRDDVHRAGFG